MLAHDRASHGRFSISALEIDRGNLSTDECREKSEFRTIYWRILSSITCTLTFHCDLQIGAKQYTVIFF